MPATIAAVASDVRTPGAFIGSRDRFEAVLSWLEGDHAGALSHGELEDQLQVDARELFRQLLQEHLQLRVVSEPRIADVTDAKRVPRPTAESGHGRGLTTVFGDVDVQRIAYRKRGQTNLHPADAVLNLPTEKHSHGLRQLAAIESSRGSFDGAVEAIGRATGQHLGKRQVEDLAARAAVDFDTFYLQRQPPTGAVTDVLVISCDGKGIVMRPGALRPATAKAAASTNPKLATRLSKGEKRNRKRLAEVGAVYDATPVPRIAADILPGNDTQRRDATAGPSARHKWLTASVVDHAATVVGAIF
ncbi:MAG: ISKra4 family transposase, partial [Chloroflexota bacterium]|nr:ISKra4 family transposase [Chloroflexota bacterium]